MDPDLLANRLSFLREAERLKDVLRSAHTSTGRTESTAEHSWRLCLMALVFADQMPGLDLSRVFQLCVVHDLGEALHGDIPAVDQQPGQDKDQQELQDLLQLCAMLDAPLREQIVALWHEYTQAATAEALAVKALDKLETLLQHTQGLNPAGFDYAFNLDYGRRYTDASALFRALREQIDKDTRLRMDAASRGNP